MKHRLLLAIALLFLVPGMARAQFSDVQNNPNRTAINLLQRASIVQGYSDGTFRPNATINRAELMKLLVEGIGITPPVARYNNCFSDVTDQWFAPYVCYAYSRDWVQGYSDGTFRPANPVNKAEALKMMLEANDQSTDFVFPRREFNDVDPNAWYGVYVGLAAERNWLAESGNFTPGQAVSRAWVAEVLYRLLATTHLELLEYNPETAGLLEDEMLQGIQNTRLSQTQFRSNPGSRNPEPAPAATPEPVQEPIVMPQPAPEQPSPPEQVGMLDTQEQALLNAMNSARQDPAGFAQQLAGLRSRYDGNIYTRPGQVPIRTSEGVSALNEAIDVLQNTQPMQPLQISTGITQSAEDHLGDIGPAGLVSHTGSDDSTPFTRMNRYGQWGGSAAENIGFGFSDGFEVVAQLIIDDGVQSRGHRKNILNPNFAFVGIACGTHAEYRYACVTPFAERYTE